LKHDNSIPAEYTIDNLSTGILASSVGLLPTVFLAWNLQPDRVMEFCKNNDLQLIVRAHECVMDGFERFAQGHLITLFSATNYCGMHVSSIYENLVSQLFCVYEAFVQV
jgi:diadenosine tetraphosphatase ApaH/serine/threonine PP2A family protein phosphatase